MKIAMLLKFAIFLVLNSVLEIEARKPVFCYWGTWSVYRPDNGRFEVNHIDGNLCTHIFYTFFGVSAKGDVFYYDEWLDRDLSNIQKTIELKFKYPHLKFMASIGGWTAGSANFSQMAKTVDGREYFAQNVLNLLYEYDFDGADIDWEYPAQRDGDPDVDKVNFHRMLRVLYTKLKPEGKMLTIATAAAELSASKSYNLGEIAKYVDFINVMTYDLHGSWDSVTGLNAPMFPGPFDTTPIWKMLNINASVNWYLSKGVPASKLVLGMPLYGRTFTLSNESNTGVNSPILHEGLPGQYTNESGLLGYNEFCEQQLNNSWTEKWEPTQMAPYAYYGDQWISYDDVRSITIKTQYALEMNLGGVMVWSIDTDDFRGLCNQGRYPLLTAINNIWNKGNDVASSPPPVTKQAATAYDTLRTTIATPIEPKSTAPNKQGPYPLLSATNNVSIKENAVATSPLPIKITTVKTKGALRTIATTIGPKPTGNQYIRPFNFTETASTSRVIWN